METLTTTRRAIQTTMGVIALAVAIVAMAARYLPINDHAVLLVAAVSPYLMLAAPVAVILLAWSRRWLVAGVAVCLTVGMLAVQVPWYVGAHADTGDSVGVRVLTANLGLGLADPHAVTESARQQTDVLVVQELTPDAVNRLSAAGLDESFSFRALDARAHASGVGVWSRYPIVETGRIGGYELAMVSTRIRIAGVSVDPTVVSAHLAGPWPQPIDDWRRELHMFPHTLKNFATAAGGGAVIVAGDFNSTTDMRPFRHLLQDGYRDAAEQAGAGRTPSFPNDSGLPPFVGIDHILTYNCAATTARTVNVPGSDHRGLVAIIEVPRSSPSS